MEQLCARERASGAKRAFFFRKKGKKDAKVEGVRIGAKGRKETSRRCAKSASGKRIFTLGYPPRKSARGGGGERGGVRGKRATGNDLRRKEKTKHKRGRKYIGSARKEVFPGKKNATITKGSPKKKKPHRHKKRRPRMGGGGTIRR